MKNIFCLLLLCLCFACAPDADIDSKTSSPGKVITPAPRKVTLKAGKNSVGATGITRDGQETTTNPARLANDLNGDGEPDRLEVVTTTEENDGLGFKRQLIVYTGEGADLDAWYTADDVILSTEQGGLMGDPLEGVRIEDGTIVIDHFGGSREKWSYEHRFRWEDGDFILDAVVIESDDPCTEFSQLDYDLPSGEAAYSTIPQDCETGEDGIPELLTFYKRQARPSMNGFGPGTHRLQAPELKGPIYY